MAGAPMVADGFGSLVSAFEQVRAVASGLLEGGFATPALDLSVVARQQDVWHLHAPELRWARVVRVIEEAVVTERVPLVRLLAPDHTGDEARHRLQDDERRELATGEHVVPDRDLLGRQAFHDALVDALVPAAEQDEPPLVRELPGERLIEPTAGRRQQQHPLG